MKEDVEALVKKAAEADDDAEARKYAQAACSKLIDDLRAFIAAQRVQSS